MRNPWTGEEDGSGGNTNTSGGINKMEEPWAGLSERTLVAMVEQLFSHLLKVLNICAHVLDDTPPGPAVKVIVFFSVFSLLDSTQNMFLRTLLCPVSCVKSVYSIPGILGLSSVPEQRPFTQSHPQKGQREGGC